MKRPPEACRPSMERARIVRATHPEGGKPCPGAPHCLGRLAVIRDHRWETRAILEALRAGRRTEGALLERWGVAP